MIMFIVALLVGYFTWCYSMYRCIRKKANVLDWAVVIGLPLLFFL